MINDEQGFETVEPFEVLPELSADPGLYASAPPAAPEYYAPEGAAEYGGWQTADALNPANASSAAGALNPTDAPNATEAEYGDDSRLNLVRDIPLTVNVELGRARKEISEILGFDIGTIIVLDKLAGDPVEIYANGKLIARGEVVVIDESYGVRITEITQS
jgi:flagellar motor switch protein FliN/FliY